MATIEIKDNNIVISRIGEDGENDSVELIFNDVNDAMSTIDNLKQKLERFIYKGAPGFEHRKWVSLSNTFADEHLEAARKIFEKHQEQIIVELKEAGID